MTTFNQFHDRNRDMQDGFERHVWGEQEFDEKSGTKITVRGTGTVDQEAIVMNNGVGMHYPKNKNTEVFLLAAGSDTANKFALLTIPRDKNRAWKEDTNGIQSIHDAKRALEFNQKRTYVDDPNFATRSGVLEVKGNTVYIRGDLVVGGDLSIAGDLRVQGRIIGPLPSGSANVNVPGFEE